jgi:hypothetical protein
MIDSSSMCACRWILITLLTGLGAGCKSASLATDSGPSPIWSTEPQQMVYVGEEVGFSFVLTDGPFGKKPRDPFGVVDYCVASVGQERVQAETDGLGHFRFVYTVLDHQAGDVIQVRAGAYVEKGVRDMRLIGDRWVRADNPMDYVDQLFAGDSIELTVYQTAVELKVSDPDRSLDMSRGKLGIIRDDGSEHWVVAEDGGAAGYSYASIDTPAGWLVSYVPTAQHVNKRGTTRVRFVVDETGGGVRTFEGFIPTP